MTSQINLRLQHHYPGFALDLDLQLPGKGVTALYGHSGSGKTTCLRCIAGLERASQAYVQINDEVWQDSQRKHFVPVHQRALGYIFQEASLFPHLSVRANLEFGLKRIARQERRVDLAHASELLGITHLLERAPNNLSGGERQRVAVARALANRPRLLLADEPTGNLDPATSQAVFEALHALVRDTGVAALIATHNMELAGHMDRVFALKDGHLEERAAEAQAY